MLYIARYRGREQERALYSSYPLRTRSHLQRFLCLCPARSSHSHPRDALNPSSWDQPILCYIIAGRVQTPRCGTGTEGHFVIEGLVHLFSPSPYSHFLLALRLCVLSALPFSLPSPWLPPWTLLTLGLAQGACSFVEITFCGTQGPTWYSFCWFPSSRLSPRHPSWKAAC